MRREVAQVRIGIGCLALFFSLIGGNPAAADLTPVGVERKVLMAVAVQTPPVIDGDLSDAAWRSAQPSGDFVNEDTGRPAGQPTTIMALNDADTLYLAFAFAEPQPERMTAKAKKDNEAVWGDDCVEINFDPSGGRKDTISAGRYQITVNSIGTKYFEVAGRGLVDTSPLRVAPKVGRSEWVLEVAVPFEALGIWRRPAAQLRWRINFERLRNMGKAQENDDWQYTAGDWTNPEVWGEVVIQGTDVEVTHRLGAEQPTAGPGNEAEFALKSLSPRERRYLCRLLDVTDGSVSLGEGEASVSAGRAMPARFPVAFRGPGLRRTILWRLMDGATGEALYTFSEAVVLAEVMRVRLRAPRYRGYVTPDLRDIEAKVTVFGNEQGRRQTTLRAQVVEEESDEVRATRDIASPGPVNMVTLPASAVGARPCRLGITLLYTQSGEEIVSESFSLKRLSAEQVKGLAYYIDQHGRLLHNGKPFLPIGFYGGSSLEHLREVGNSPFNTMLCYSMTGWSEQQLQTYLDTAGQLGVHVIFDAKDLYPASAGTPEEWDQAMAEARRLIARWRGHPALIAWYLNDERGPEVIPQLKRSYQTFRDNDPDHPCLIVHNRPSIYYMYAHTCDLLAPDPYPVPNTPVTAVSDWTQAAVEAMDGEGAAWSVPQAFGWYQMMGPEDPSLGMGRDRIPTANELKTGRAPNYEEERCMTWLALVHGAKGIVYWVYYNMRQLPQYPEMWAWMQDLCREVQSLEPVILSPNEPPPPTFSPKPEAVHCMAKEYQGKVYLFVVNGERHPWLGWARLAGGIRCDGAVDVLSGDSFEGRGNAVALRLPALGVRVLRLK
jgi:hypothetical protein